MVGPAADALQIEFGDHRTRQANKRPPGWHPARSQAAGRAAAVGSDAGVRAAPAGYYVNPSAEVACLVAGGVLLRLAGATTPSCPSPAAGATGGRRWTRAWGGVVFVLRDVTGLAVQRVDTELAQGWVTTPAQTALDHADRPGLGGVDAAEVLAAIRQLAGEAEAGEVADLAAAQRKRAAHRRLAHGPQAAR